jgi:hypothetical protein
MYVIITHKGDRRRLEIPPEIDAKGAQALDAYCAKPPADAWAAATVVGPNWPHADAAPDTSPADAEA